jgi:hypothetical protein
MLKTDSANRKRCNVLTAMPSLETNRLVLRNDLAELKRLAEWIEGSAGQEIYLRTSRLRFNFASKKLSPTSSCMAAQKTNGWKLRSSWSARVDGTH